MGCQSGIETASVVAVAVRLEGMNSLILLVTTKECSEFKTTMALKAMVDQFINI